MEWPLNAQGSVSFKLGYLAIANRQSPIANRLQHVAAHDPQELADLHADEIRQRLFTKTSDLPEGVQRLLIKSIRLNRAPRVFGNLRVVG